MKNKYKEESMLKQYAIASSFGILAIAIFYGLQYIVEWIIL